MSKSYFDYLMTIETDEKMKAIRSAYERTKFKLSAKIDKLFTWDEWIHAAPLSFISVLDFILSYPKTYQVPIVYYYLILILF